VRPFAAAGGYRRIGLVWRTAFPHSQDLTVLGRFIQDQLPKEAGLGAVSQAPAAARRDAELEVVSL
jgi:hypothetical protein